MIDHLREIFVDPNNLFYSVLLMVCFGIFVLEVVGLLFGATTDWLDNIIPDSFKFDVHLDGDSPNFFVASSSWLYFGQIPLLIWLIIFFGGWGTLGLVLQSLASEQIGFSFEPIVSLPVTFALNLFLVHFVCKIVKPIIPKDETTAIELDQLIGRDAEIVIGTARLNFPAQAKVTDSYGTTHYIMVVPDKDEECKQGDKVYILEKKENIFVVFKLFEGQKN